jgi:succinyl-diaminopimelate desuccinylase
MNSTLPKDTAELLARRTLDLVRIASPSGLEAAAADHVERFLREATAPAFLRRHGNALVAGYGERPRLVLAGHLDTVPAQGHPEPSLAGGEVSGLGSTDMKGGLAVMMTLAERAAPRDGEPAEALPFALVFYDREETAYERNGLRPLFIPESWLTEAELALLLEPTANTVELGCLGTLHALVTFHGTAAHSARPWMGENAIHKAAPFIARVAEMGERELRQGPALFREVISVTLAEGGSTRNVVPDRCTVNVNFRFAPDRSPEEAEAEVRSLIPEGATVQITDLAPGAPAHADAPLLAHLIREGNLETRAKQAWTDAAQFAKRGVAAANFGPGIPELAHQREERVPMANLVRSLDILTRLVLKEDR